MILYRKLVNVLNIPSEKPKLQNTLPPETPPIRNKKGPFCIRAFCELNDIVDFTGFDTDYKISQDTQDICDSYAKGHSDKRCSRAVISIVPIDDIQNCERHIIYHNQITEATSIFFP